MRLVSWNINGARHPGSASYAQQAGSWEALRAMKAEVILLQEVDPKAIPEWARAHWTLHGLEGTWGSVVGVIPSVASEPAPRADPWLEIVSNYVTLATLNANGQSVLLVSVHAPATKADEFLRRSLNKPGAIAAEELAKVARPQCPPYALDIIFGALQRRPLGERFIVAGDMNEARLFDETMPETRGAAVEFFHRAKANGWEECCCPDGVEQRTFVKKESRAYQLDHLFCDRATRAGVRSFRVVPEDEVKGLSDHVPLVVELDVV